ncbi:MAG: signal peptidase II [Syntrophobacteraceae bacterium]|nr:signal peptidase II [Syntrophobacteraceae bacterium]
MADSKIRKTMLFVIPIGILVISDQLTKYLIARSIPANTGFAVVPGFFNVVYVHNPGGAFSLFASAGHPWAVYALAGISIAVVAAIAYAFGKTRKGDNWTRIAYVCVAGGAVGNLVDRIRFGEVTDFLDFHAGNLHWPAFNVADMAISTGAVMLLISLMRGK